MNLIRCFAAMAAVLGLAGITHAGISNDCNGNGIDDGLDLLSLGSTVQSNNCATAGEVGPGFTYTGTTVGATDDGTATCANSANSPDVWFRYTPARSGRTQVSLCGSTFDTALSIWTGCAGAGVQVACNDDFCGVDSQLEFDAVVGTSYLIRIAGYSGETGSYTMTLSGPSSAFGSGVDSNVNGVLDVCELDYFLTPDTFYFPLLIGDEPTTASVVLQGRQPGIFTFTSQEQQPGITVTPMGGVADTSVTLELMVDPAVLPPGDQQFGYGFQVYPGDNPTTSTFPALRVNYSLREPTPDFQLSPSSRSAALRVGSGRTTFEYTLRNGTGRPTPFIMAVSNNVMTVAPPSGTVDGNPTTVTLTLNPDTLPLGPIILYVYTAADSNFSNFRFSVLNLEVLPPDCNGNDIDDVIDIEQGVLADCNRDGLADVCQLTTATDANANGQLDSCEPALYAPLPFYEPFPASGDILANHWMREWTADGRPRITTVGRSGGALDLSDLVGTAPVLLEADFQEPGQANLFLVRGISSDGNPDYLANFAYDTTTYRGPSAGSTATRPSSIPMAPNSADDVTTNLVLRLEVNQLDAFPSTAAVSIFPSARELHEMGDFSLTFDAFTCFNGTGSATGASASGTGTTEFMGGGLAATADLPQAPFLSARRSFAWSSSIDGGVTIDYTYFESGSDTTLVGQAIPNWWGAGSSNTAGNAANWTGLFTNPAYEQAGTGSKAWVTVEMVKTGNVVKLYFTPAVGTRAGQRTEVASWTPGVLVPTEEGLPTAGAPFITFYDSFASIAQFPADQFILIDNVVLRERPSNDIPSQNEATLGINLANASSVRLSFNAHVFGESADAPLEGPSANHVQANAVLLSTDLGTTWHEVHSLRQPTDGFTPFEIDLSALATDRSLVLTSQTLVRFSQYGNQTSPSGGYVIDDVRLFEAATETPVLDVVSSPGDLTIEQGSGGIVNAIVSFRSAGVGSLDITGTPDVAWLAAASAVSYGGLEILTFPISSDAVSPGVYPVSITLSEEMNLVDPVTLSFTVTVLPPAVRNWSFDSAADGWLFAPPAIAGFDGEATGAHNVTTGALSTETSSTLALGVWESARIQPVADGGSVTPGSIAIQAGNLYRVAWTATSNPGGKDAPTVRLRVSDDRHHRTDEFVLTSEDVRAPQQPLLALQPTASTHVAWIRPAFQPATSAPVRGLVADRFVTIYFDVIAIDPTKANNSVTDLTAISIERRSETFVSQTTVLEADFRNSNPNEFSPASAAPAVAAPQVFEATTEGLLIRGTAPADRKNVFEPAVTIYGNWGIEAFLPFPENDGNPNRLILLEWTVGTTASSAERGLVPPYRLRMTTASLGQSNILTINSNTDGGIVPADGERAVYRMYVTPPAGGDSMMFFFDYAWAPGAGDDPSIGVFLEKLVVKEIVLGSTE